MTTQDNGERPRQRCVLTMHEVQSIKDLIFVVGGNSESSAQKAIFEILADGIRKATASHTSAPVPEPDEYYLIRIGELMEITDHFKRQSNPLIAKRMGGIISDISSRRCTPEISHTECYKAGYADGERKVLAPLEAVREKFNHLDRCLSDPEWCNSGDGAAIYGIAGEMWRAIKEATEVKP
jgi:hypothetical protein